MIICAKPWPVLGMKHNVAILKKIGYKQIRYDPNTTIFRRKREGTPVEIFKRDFDVVQEAGMSIEEFHSFSMGLEEYEKRADLYIEMMKLADVRFIVQHIDEEMLNNTDSLNKIIKKFKDNGIYFCIENECEFRSGGGFVITFEKMDEILKKLPDAKVCLDTGHSFRAGIDPDEYFERYKDKIKVIHLHDVIDGQDHHVPFTGKLVESSIVPKLKSFKGPIVIELFLPIQDLMKEKYGKAMEMLSKHLL